jgi:hypothetical protein
MLAVVRTFFGAISYYNIVDTHRIKNAQNWGATFYYLNNDNYYNNIEFSRI